MPLDGLTLRCALHELGDVSGARLDKITQHEAETLVLHFRKKENFRLLISARADAARLHLTRESYKNPETPFGFCMLLRKRLAGAAIESISQPGSERHVTLVFAAKNELLDDIALHLEIELMGKHSNIILTDGVTVLDAVKRIPATLSRVRQVLPGLPYSPPPAQNKLDPLIPADYSRILAQLQTGTLSWKALSGLSPRACAELDALSALYGPQQAFQRFINPFLTGAYAPCLSGSPPTDFFAFPYISAAPPQREMPLHAAIDAYYSHHETRKVFEGKRNALAQRLSQITEKLEKKRGIYADALAGSQGMEAFRIWGELLTANFYRLNRGLTEAVLENYYENNAPIRIPLQEALSPQENARHYFKKFNKMKTAANLAAGQLTETDAELSYLAEARQNLTQCENAEDLAQWKEELTAAGYWKPEGGAKKKAALPSRSQPYAYRAPDGTRILAGKNNLQNEKLTFGARAEDIWLHAKNRPGSHVIIESASPSQETLALALKVASFHSSGAGAKTDIDFTPRRNVKKIHGAKPGQVTYKNQQTLPGEASPGDLLPYLSSQKDI